MKPNKYSRIKLPLVDPRHPKRKFYQCLDLDGKPMNIINLPDYAIVECGYFGKRGWRRMTVKLGKDIKKSIQNNLHFVYE